MEGIIVIQDSMCVGWLVNVIYLDYLIVSTALRLTRPIRLYYKTRESHLITNNTTPFDPKRQRFYVSLQYLPFSQSKLWDFEITVSASCRPICQWSSLLCNLLVITNSKWSVRIQLLSLSLSGNCMDSISLCWKVLWVCDFRKIVWKVLIPFHGGLCFFNGFEEFSFFFFSFFFSMILGFGIVWLLLLFDGFEEFLSLIFFWVWIYGWWAESSSSSLSQMRESLAWTFWTSCLSVWWVWYCS